jgi:hypothetical protein
MLGAVPYYAAFNHRQGDNPEHFTGDCGLVSVEDVLRQFGMNVTETDLVTHALQARECYVDPAGADYSGGTLPSQDAAILADYGVPSRAESGLTLAQLAGQIRWPRRHRRGQLRHPVAGTRRGRQRRRQPRRDRYRRRPRSGQRERAGVLHQ